MSFSKDPAEWGPQVWSEIHNRALGVCTPEAAYNYANWLTQLCNSLPCETCREHATAYIKSNSPIQWAIRNNDDTGMFRYTVIMHNFVNNKLNKPSISMDQAHSIWGVSRCSRQPYSSSSRTSVRQVPSAYKPVSYSPSSSNRHNNCAMQ